MKKTIRMAVVVYDDGGVDVRVLASNGTFPAYGSLSMSEDGNHYIFSGEVDIPEPKEPQEVKVAVERVE